MEIEIIDEVGNVDLCEVEEAPSTRVIRIIRRVNTVEPAQLEDRSYVIQFQHACGYRD